MTALQYVILRHDGIDEPHFDLMFETYPGSQLSTWRSTIWPISELTPLTRLKDHRRLFLNFEGELSGQRGYVSQIARGTCTVEVGENAVWTIRLLTGTPSQQLILESLDEERWQGSLA